MAYFTIDLEPGRIEMPQVVRYADREFDRYLPVDELDEQSAEELHASLDALDAEYARKSAALRIALEMRDAARYMPSLFDSVAA